MAKKTETKTETKTNAVATVDPKHELTAGMAEVTRKVALAGADKILLGTKFSIALLHDVGTLLNEIFTDPAIKKAKTIDEELKKLIRFWNHPSWNLSSLYDLRNVAVTFSRDTIIEECSTPMSNGKLLTWSHFKELQKVGQEKRRLALLKKVRENNLSANELILELQGNKESAVKRAGGRKPSIPKTPTAVIQKLSSTVQHTDNYLQSIMEPFEAMIEAQTDKLDDRFIDNLSEALEQMEAMETRLHKAAAKLSALKDKISTGVENDDEEENEEGEEAEVEVEETDAAGATFETDEDEDEEEEEPSNQKIKVIGSVEGTSTFELNDDEEDEVVPVVAAKTNVKTQHKLAGKINKKSK